MTSTILMAGSREASSLGVAVCGRVLSTGSLPSARLLCRSLKSPQVLLDELCICRLQLAAGHFFADIHACRSACTAVRRFAFCAQVGVGHQLGGVGGDL